MPELNSPGQALMASEGDGTVSVDRLPILQRAGQARWLNDRTVIANALHEGRWQVITIRQNELATAIDAAGANRIVAGGGRWLGWSNGRGMFGSLGDDPQAFPLGAGRDGTLAWRRDYHASAGLVLTPPSGPEREVADAVVVDIQVLGPGTAIWWDGQRLHAVGRPVPRCAVPPTGLRCPRLVHVDGQDWLIYWTESVGLVAQIDGASEGFVLETRPIAFRHDATVVKDLLIVAWSKTRGEGPGDLEWLVIDRAAPPMPIVPRVDRPLWLGAFEFGQSEDRFPANCVLRVRDPMFVVSRWPEATPVRILAHYVAGQPEGDIDALERAVALAALRFRGVPTLAYWTRGPQQGRLPAGADLVGIEAYRGTDETLEAFEARVRRAIAKAPRCWLICQGYTQPPPSMLTTELVPLVPIYARLARECPTVEGLLVFSAGTRPGGWRDHPEVHDAWHRLAAGIPGAPALPPAPLPGGPPGVPPAPDPVHPDRPDPPTSPPPASPFHRAKEVSLMDAEIVGLVGPGGKFLRIDPGQPTRIHFDRDSVGAHERFEVTKPDDRFTLRAVEANVILNGAPLWSCDGVDLQRQFETRPVDARGAHERWTIVELPSGDLDAFVEHETSDGRRFTSAHLTVVRGI